MDYTDITKLERYSPVLLGRVEAVVMDEYRGYKTIELINYRVTIAGNFYCVLVSPPLDYSFIFINVDMYSRNKDGDLEPALTGNVGAPFRDGLSTFERVLYQSLTFPNIIPDERIFRQPATSYILGMYNFQNAFNKA